MIVTVIAITIIALVILYRIGAASSGGARPASANGASDAARAPLSGRTLPRTAVQGLIDQMHYDEQVVFQSPAVIMENEQHPRERGELVVSTRKVHWLAYDETGYGVAGGFAFDIGEVLAIRRRSWDTLVLFVDDPEYSTIVGDRSGAVTTRFTFRAEDATAWLECFHRQHEVSHFRQFESYTDTELADQPIADWTERITFG
ncbi:hypothetical protein ACI78V_05130 [Geodermatophilus sp. SYSU D00742]